MMPCIDPRQEARKKRVQVAVFITACAAAASGALSGTRFNAWQWAPWVLGIIAIAVFATINMAASGGRPGGRGRGSVIGGRGWNDDGPAGATAHRWQELVMVSRLMPRSAGRRWLAEAESLLSEIATARGHSGSLKHSR